MKHYFFLAFYLICNVIIYLFQGSVAVYIAAFLAFLFVIIWGASNVGLGYFVNSITHKKTKKKEVALTFDDGPTEFTPLFLDILKKNQIKATFFCIGKQIEKHPDIFKRIIEEGHSIGNHTYSHSNKTGLLSTSEMVKEISRCDDAIQQFGNISTPFYRPPFGVTNPNISRAISKTKKISVGWNIRSFDTKINDYQKIVKKIDRQLKPGSIILLHDTSQKSLQVLADLLLILQRKDYSTFTVEEIKK